jgi:hypothetical protein
MLTQPALDGFLTNAAIDASSRAGDRTISHVVRNLIRTFLRTQQAA